MLDGGLYQGRCIIACIFCLKKHWTMTGGLMGGGEVGGGWADGKGVYNRLLRCVSFFFFS